MLVIVDYGMGNVRSVLNAFESLGAVAQISSDPQVLRDADRIVLPGVGAFGEAMDRLRERALLEPLAREVIEARKPFLGICLGMQLMAERSLEHGEHRGLGWIPGEVRRIEPRAADGNALRVPHVGWNQLDVAPGAATHLLRDLPKQPTFYFVHSFQFVPRAGNESVVTGTSDYGGAVTAVVERAHLMGTQFHPEKSQKAGLALLRNFLAFPSASTANIVPASSTERAPC